MATSKNTIVTDHGEVLKDYAFRNHRHYPWAEWTDGKVRRLTRGKHFTCSVVAMSTSCYARGRKLRKAGQNVKAAVNMEGDKHLVVQFTTLPGKPEPSTYTPPAKKVGKKTAKKSEARQITNS